jgi:predicted nucleotidyltransferase
MRPIDNNKISDRNVQIKNTNINTLQNHKKSYDLNDENWIKILKLFFDGPKVTLHIREVARRSKLTPRGSKYILDSLKNEGLLNNESNGIVSNYWGNYNNEKFMGLKRSLNLYSLYSSGLIPELEGFYRIPKCIILFGSYAKGEDTSKSDIDIAVITDMEGLPELIKYEKILNRKINITLIKNVKLENANFINSIANGIVLSGYLEVV